MKSNFTVTQKMAQQNHANNFFFSVIYVFIRKNISNNPRISQQFKTIKYF